MKECRPRYAWHGCPSVRESSPLWNTIGFTSEGILPLDGDIDIFVGPSSFQVNPASIEAFRVPRGTFVRLNPGVLHGRQFVVDSQSVNVMILLPERTFGNDCVFTRLAESDQIKILL